MPAGLQNVVLAYFPIRGRGEPIRLMLEDASIPYTEIGPSECHFQETKMDCDLFLFNQLPRLEVNGLKLAQRDAILRYLAKQAGYGGSGHAEEDVVVDMLGCAVEGLMGAYLDAVYSDNAQKLLVDFVKGQAPKSLRQYEHLLKKHQSKAGYFIYDHPSFAEFHLWYTISAISRLDPSLLGHYEALSAWFKLFEARPRIAEYLASGKQKEMLNGSPSAQSAVV